jgi:uncharacterized membrane protein HdeD (DUF308 family)
MMTSAAQAIPVGEKQAERAWLPIAWGVAAIAFGLLLFVRPGPTAVFLVRVMAIFWLVGGVVDLVGGVLQRRRPWAIWRTIGGVVGIFAALLVLANPLFGTFIVIGAQFLLIAGSALIEGTINVVQGLRAGPLWGLVALGAFQLGVGILLVAQPLVGILAFVQFLAAVLIIGGAITIVQTLRRR